MSANFGPVETWLRFGLVVALAAIMLYGAIWFANLASASPPLWFIVAVVLICLALVIVAYERLIGWG